jgi:prepilin-type processing-associated H-X9-DG protein
MIYEESEGTIDDGNGELYSANWGNTDLLAIRHNKGAMRTQPDQAYADGIPNGQGQGNVMFADGHAELVTREFAHSKGHAAPDPNVFSSKPEILLKP